MVKQAGIEGLGIFLPYPGNGDRKCLPSCGKIDARLHKGPLLSPRTLVLWPRMKRFSRIRAVQVC